MAGPRASGASGRPHAAQTTPRDARLPTRRAVLRGLPPATALLDAGAVLILPQSQAWRGFRRSWHLKRASQRPVERPRGYKSPTLPPKPPSCAGFAPAPGTLAIGAPRNRPARASARRRPPGRPRFLDFMLRASVGRSAGPATRGPRGAHAPRVRGQKSKRECGGNPAPACRRCRRGSEAARRDRPKETLDLEPNWGQGWPWCRQRQQELTVDIGSDKIWV